MLIKMGYSKIKKIVIALLILLVTHYIIIPFYGKKAAISAIPQATRESTMALPKQVVFPTNSAYHPKKSDDRRKPSLPIAVKDVETDSRHISETNLTLKVSSIKTTKSKIILSDRTTTRKPPSTVPKSSSVALKPAAYDDSKRLILAWTSLHSKKPLWGIRPWSFRNCKYKNCEITGNRSQLDQADLVIFRIRELKTDDSAEPYRPYVLPLDFSDMPPYHPSNQLWMDINQESPVYTHADEEVSRLNNVFNISSNYLINSDYSISYIPEVKLKVKPDNTNHPVDYSAGKTKMAVWFVSHCSAASGRDEYVKELQKYNITVDIIGKCTGMSDGCTTGNHTCYNSFRRKYKFYLAFENSICKEYITEKFWNTLISDSYNIPIALGASVEDYTHFAPPNSFIHTRNFTSVKALAQYMHKVSSDRDAFNSYHRWRETHDIKPKTLSESLHCYMCRQAHEKKDGKPEYKNLSKYWSRKNHCAIEPEPIN